MNNFVGLKCRESVGERCSWRYVAIYPGLALTPLLQPDPMEAVVHWEYNCLYMDDLCSKSV